MKASILSLLLCLTFSLPSFAQSSGKQKTREFLMSCSYGILTGTLIGAASLAFTDNPGDNLHRIARGASLGLYAGIALGYYVNSLDDQPVIDPAYTEEPLPDAGVQLQFIPRFDQAKLDGFEFKFHLMNF